jgi:hypothetical protein
MDLPLKISGKLTGFYPVTFMIVEVIELGEKDSDVFTLEPPVTAAGNAV